MTRVSFACARKQWWWASRNGSPPNHLVYLSEKGAGLSGFWNVGDTIRVEMLQTIDSCINIYAPRVRTFGAHMRIYEPPDLMRLDIFAQC